MSRAESERSINNPNVHPDERVLRHPEHYASTLQRQLEHRQQFKAKNFDDQELPASKLKAPIDFNTVTEDSIAGIGGSVRPQQDKEMRYTDIPSTHKSIADGLVSYFGEECCIKMFNRQW